jgi:Zn-dependent protease with chaperone function
MSIIIKGIQRNGNEELYDAVQIIGDKYNVKIIEIIIDKRTAVARTEKSHHLHLAIPPISASDVIFINPDIPSILKKEYLEAVFAHEFSHVVNNDMHNPGDLALVLFVSFSPFILGIPILLLAAIGACLLSILLVIILVSAVFLLCRNRRAMEVRSDRDAALKTSPATMIATLDFLDEYINHLPKNKKNSVGIARRVVGYLTHPSLAKRKALLINLEKEMYSGPVK